MSILQILKIIGAVLTLATGIFSLVAPRAIQGFTGLTAPGARGISEFRAVFGGLFIALGAVPLVLNSPVAYNVLGYGYLTIGVVRAVSIVFDKSYERSNIISLAVEIVCGLILSAPNLF